MKLRYSLYDGTDYSVCTSWAIRGEGLYLLDVYRERLDFPTLKRRVLDLRDHFGADSVVVEDQGSGTSLIQQLSSERCLYPIAFKPEGSKVDRMAAQSALIEAGRVHLPAAAPWIDEFKSEILAFPFGGFDDQVDSVSQFLNWYESYREPSVSSFPI